MREDLDDEAYRVLLRGVEDEVVRIIGSYIAWSGHEYDDRAEMDFILYNYTFRLGAWNTKKTAEQWDNICRKAREIQRLWNDIDSNAQLQLKELFSVAPFRNDRGAEFKVTSRYDLAHFLDFGGDILTEVEREGRQVLTERMDAGRRNIRAVAVVDACRVVWHRRTGRTPSISMRAFGGFLTEIFAALEPLGFTASPEAAYKAWAEFVER